MPGKRQHYVPRFLLNRFAADPTDKRSLIYKQEKRRGAPRPVNPVNEVVIGHFYRIVLGDGTVMNEADEALDRIETMAAEAVVKLVDPAFVVTTDEALRLMLFIVSLKNRTPQAREALREFDERAAELDFEVKLSDRKQYHQVMGNGRDEQEVEDERLSWLEDLRSGRIGLASSPDREVALMFMQVPEVVEELLRSMGWVCVRIPVASKASFVISDHPVAHYDPTPKVPEAGASFASSPSSMTWVPLDPKFGILLTPDRPGTWVTEEADDSDIEELNLLTYAWAREAIYGPSQRAVAEVRRAAKQRPSTLGKFRYRPPRFWVTEGRDQASGPHVFTSRFKDQTARRTFHISEDGMAEVRRQATVGGSAKQT